MLKDMQLNATAKLLDRQYNGMIAYDNQDDMLYHEVTELYQQPLSQQVKRRIQRRSINFVNQEYLINNSKQYYENGFQGRTFKL
jgi:hypothetical protein